MAEQRLVSPERVQRAILILRGRRAILDLDLAALYGVSVKRLNEQVKRNSACFPQDFVFRLTRGRVLSRAHSEINQQFEWPVLAPAVDAKIAVEGQDAARAKFRGQVNQARVGQIHGNLGVLFHQGA